MAIDHPTPLIVRKQADGWAVWYEGRICAVLDSHEAAMNYVSAQRKLRRSLTNFFNDLTTKLKGIH